MDKIDRHTLKALQKDGRKKNSELTKETGLAPSTMLDRVNDIETLENNYLDKHNSINLTVQALIQSGIGVIAAKNLH